MSYYRLFSYFYGYFLTYLFLFNQTWLGCSYLKQLCLICTASSSIRTRSNCSTCLLLPRYIRNLLMFTPALTSMMTSAPESWTNSVSQCSATSVQSFKAQSVIQGNILPRAKMWRTRINSSVSSILFTWLHRKCRTDFFFLAARNRRLNSRLRGRRASASFSSCLLWITRRGGFRYCARRHGCASPYCYATLLI